MNSRYISILTWKQLKIKQMDEKIKVFENQLKTLTKGSDPKLPGLGGFIKKIMLAFREFYNI